MTTTTERLAAANRIKQERAALRASIEELSYPVGSARVAELFMSPPRFLHSLEVQTLVRWVPRMGEQGVERVCAFAEVSPIARVAEYGPRRGTGPIATERQRRRVAEALLRGVK